MHVFYHQTQNSVEYPFVYPPFRQYSGNDML